MKYCALVNTGSPGTGLITVGEVLTEKQMAALGADKINELVDFGKVGGIDGVLGACGEAPAAPRPAPEKAQKPEPKPEPEAEPENDEELPELGMPEDIVKDEAAEAPKALKKGGRRKAK